MAKDTKERILMAALDMFSQNGYAGTNIRELAASLNMGKSSLYRHFESKEEIWNTLLDRMIDKMWDGEHFVALKNYTHEPIFSGSNMHYIPLVLGKRLPQNIIDKMCEDKQKEIMSI